MPGVAEAPPDPPAALVWIDLEMTGLDPDRCKILEIATLVTNAELEVLAEGPDLVVHHCDEVLDGMDPWCVEHHVASGLTAASRASRVELAQAEAQTLEFLRRHTVAGESPLCGNSVWQDRRFLARHMPALEAFLHYRLVDVSTVKELCRRWYPATELPKKGEAHRALDDIRESLEELRYYRRHIFAPSVRQAP
jgi:oligoribonuclease